MATNGRLCRITGLTSPKGLQLNGSAGRIVDPKGDRFAVCIDGHPGGPMSLKRSNIEILPDDAFDGGVGVGRGTLRDSHFNAIVVDQRTGQIITKLGVSGGSARSRGCLMVIEEFLKHYHRSRGKGALLLMPTDLNVARALNRVATGDRDVQLNAPLKGTLKSVARLLQRETTETGNMVLFKYEPHRIHPDGEKCLGAGRHKAVLTGAFKVYPCPYEAYHDAMEVRYVDGTSNDQAVVKHEIYLDYGREEAESYVRHAVALGESDRLSPSTLAQVDPQAFWSAALHAEAFMEALENCECLRLVEEWKRMVQGVLKGRELWTKVASGSLRTLPPVVAAGDGSDWGIRSEADHKQVSNNCAIEALMMMLKATSEHGNGESAGSGDVAERELKPVLIEMLEYYKGTELDRLITAFVKAGLRERERVACGKQLKAKHRDLYLNEALAEEGFGSDALDLKSDPLAHCGHCGSDESKKLKRCGRCNGAAYCSRDCQKAAWKEHKKECDPILAQGRRIMRDCALRSGVEIKAEVYKPRSTLPTETAMISETSGIGSVGILWFPGQKSILTFTDMSHGTETLTNAVKDHIAFANLSELAPPLRFLLTCGPLPDINIARNSLDDALSFVNGDITKIRMNAAGFTALEWAAKKGNGETVEWLCTDDRTNALVNVGSPVGWACYTGQVAIARALVAYGADPNATNAVLWGGTPPLLVAAQNGQLEAMKYLVDELGQDIHLRDPWGKDVLLSIKTAPNWKELEGHKRSYDWAKEKMG